MPNIPELKIGSTTYDLHDKRVDDLKSVFNGNNENHYDIVKNNANAFPTFYPGELLSTEQNGVASFTGAINTGVSTFRRAVATVEQGKRYVISGTKFNSNFPAYLLLKGTTIVKCASLVNSDSETVFVEEIICVDADADTIWVNGYTGHVEVREALSLGNEEIFERDVSIGCILPGVIDNSFNIALSDSTSFSHVVAPVRKGGVYYITGTQFPANYCYAYVLFKAGQVVGYDTIPSGTTQSSESFFTHHEITVSVDADEIFVNGYRNSCCVETKLSESRKPAAAPVYDWQQVEAPVLNGVRGDNGYNENVGSHCVYMVRPGETVRLHSRQWLSPYYPLFVCLRNDVYVNRNPIEYPTDTWQTVEYTIPDNVNCIILNGYSMSEPPTLWRKLPVDTKEYVDFTVKPYKKLSSSNYWEGKKIVWFGTSIPAGGANPGDTVGDGSYPLRVGEMLGATVYNEAVGSSCVRYGNYAFATENDPHGLAGQWLNNFLYSLAGSTEEKQMVFDNWSYWKTVIQSGQVSGVTLTDAQKSRALECCYDNKLYKYLTGGSVGPVDLYVFDHGHNEEYRGDYDNMKTIPPTGHETDRSYFIGAMRFLIEKILNDNPKARICFIGHYQNDIKKGVSEAQLELANIWKYPLCKTWELIGWSQNTVTIDGETKTLTQVWMPDNLHPSSDTTGEALKHYAEVLYPFMRDVR